MEKNRERLFIDELKTQIEFALLSVKEVNKFLTASDTEFPKDTTPFWFNAQNLIVYSGNISKILWGVNSKNEKINEIRKKERKILRKKLGVSEESILKKRYLRNALEHIDEKLEDFTKKPQMIMNKNFGPVKGMVQIGESIYDVSKERNLRHYDQDEKMYYFYGESVNLEELYKGILQLDKNIKEYEVINDDFYR
ncbi:hypothetical protein [Carnobacterium sp. TMP28]|uniref:hypothetical protein n=1 Tax=Carnobacterium sp. TMP28 TaxID=3397060 RepID=UPI0039DFE52A